MSNQKQNYRQVKDFILHNFRHFNSAVLVDASEAYVKHINGGGKMMIAMAGAMSTAELGITLSDMIRKDKVHALTCTGANLEEDLFNLVAHNYYVRIPHYRHLSPKDEVSLFKKKMNRVTDTCIPEEEAMRKVEKEILKFWQKAEKDGKRYLPYEFIYQLINSGCLKKYYQIDPKDSWVVTACKKNIPIFVPGWEDSTLGNTFVSCVRKGTLKDLSTVKSGMETMDLLIDW